MTKKVNILEEDRKFKAFLETRTLDDLHLILEVIHESRTSARGPAKKLHHAMRYDVVMSEIARRGKV